VFTRDHFACVVPGCTSKRFLRLHHLRHREYGGSNLASNLVTLCDGHHRLLHDGVIAIGGTAPDALVFTLPSTPDGTEVCAQSRGDRTVMSMTTD
jgi:hypothetical protein